MKQVHKEVEKNLRNAQFSSVTKKKTLNAIFGSISPHTRSHGQAGFLAKKKKKKFAKSVGQLPLRKSALVSLPLRES